MMKKFLLLAVVLCAPLFSQISYNVSLYGNVDNYTGGVNGNDYSEVWGWTDSVKNREYAIIGTSQGTSIVDITTQPIKEVSFLIGPPSTYNYHEFRTYKNYLYIGSEGSTIAKHAGIQIVDLSTLPDSATFKKVFVWIDTLTGGGTKSYYRAHTVSIEKNFLYVNGGDFGGTRIMDISDPLNPLQVGSYGKGSTPYVHDAIIRNDTLYASAIDGGRIDIVDFTTKGHYTQNTTAKIVSKTPTVPEGRTHQSWLSEDGNYMFVATEVGGGHLHIYNITDRTTPIEIATWTSNSTTSIHNVFVKGDFLYIAYYADGFRVLDVSNPYNPIEVAFYDTYPNPSPTLYQGAWGVYPYFPSGKIAVSDMNTGLYVFTVDLKYGGNVTGIVRDAATNQPLANVEVLVKEMGRKYLTDGNGRYKYGTASGAHTITFSKSGYVARTETVMTNVGKLDTLDLTLTPVATSTEMNQNSSTPAAFFLSQNFPNPFNPSTRINYGIPRSGFVTLYVYDALGRRVRELVHEYKEQGTYSVTCETRGLPSGIYVYRLLTENFTAAKTMTLLK
jgi:choice-of-anchor B domain-containing protein